MKVRNVLVAVVVAAIFVMGSVGLSNADMFANGQSIRLIDGKYDNSSGDVTVSSWIVSIPSQNLYYSLDRTPWTLVTSNTIGPFANGSKIDFGLDTNSTSSPDIFSYKTADATLEYKGDIEKSYASHQGYVIGDYYYRNLIITWLSLDAPLNIEFIGANNDDGFTPVPLPEAFWLLGSGLIALVGIRRKAFFG